ncbi:uncharacterized protein LOC121467959 isoform X2 [Drosophila elegans]|uniref:uncharacterized protein LOC121467959 isoform X2 n=1 Tax=Drosophila elegans TaxID=30023 RepID=UPI001BC85131|nr:uncharacterized protein LOC121467959 isoform X2 [Drosophila elegans]
MSLMQANRRAPQLLSHLNRLGSSSSAATAGTSSSEPPDPRQPNALELLGPESQRRCMEKMRALPAFPRPKSLTPSRREKQSSAVLIALCQDRGTNVLKNREPVYQAIWADSTDFDEVLISPVMLQDHMPDKVLAALKKVVTTSGPRKPQRQTSNAFSTGSHDAHDTDLEPPHCSNRSETTTDAMRSEAEPETDRMPTMMSQSQSQLHHCKRPSQSSYTSLSNCLVLTPTAQHKLCLETSFTNGSVPPAPAPAAASQRLTSAASSLLSSTTTPYDISSALDDSLATVALRQSPSLISAETTATVIGNHTDTDLDEIAMPRLKAVAFDMALTPPPSLPPERSVLGRQHSEKKPRSLPLAQVQAPRRASDAGMAVPGVDLLHDDWYGLAPLASPETLSEISSVSSRTSVPISLANSIERYLQHMGVGVGAAKVPLEDIFESQLHTPKVMRRAPKFSENLAGCAEDTRNLDQYKRLGRVFITFPRIFPDQSSSPPMVGRSLDSSGDSFESASAHSLQRVQLLLPPGTNAVQSSKSADPLDGLDPDAKAARQPAKKLTFSDSDILADADCLRLCPHCPCDRDVQRGCCTRSEHGRCTSGGGGGAGAGAGDAGVDVGVSGLGVGSTDTSFYSASSSLDQFASTPARQNGGPHLPEEILMRPGVLESHFPVLGDGSSSSNMEMETPALVAPASPTPAQLSNGKRPDVVGGRVRKRLSSEEFFYSRSADQDHLVASSTAGSTAGITANATTSHLVQFGDRGSPAGRRRGKGCVYPAGNSLRLDAAAAAAATAAASGSPTSISKFTRTRVATGGGSAAKQAAANNESNV